MSTLATTFKPGDVVRVFNWHGIVQDVYQSTTNRSVVIEVLFAKNIFKAQPAELHRVTPTMLIEPATLEDFQTEAEELSAGQNERLAEAINGKV